MTYMLRVGGAQQEILTEPSQTTFTMPLGAIFDDQVSLDFSLDDGDRSRRSYYRVTVPGRRARKDPFTDLVFTRSGKNVAVSSTNGEITRIADPAAFYTGLFDSARQDIATYWYILGVSEKTDQIETITAGRAVQFTFYSDQPDVLPLITATETEIRSLWESVAKLEVTMDLSTVAVSIDAGSPLKLPNRIALAPGRHEIVVKINGTPVRSETVMVDAASPRHYSLPLMDPGRTRPAPSASTGVMGAPNHVKETGDPGRNRAILVTLGIVLVIVVLSFLSGFLFFGFCIPAARLHPGLYPEPSSSRGTGSGCSSMQVHDFADTHGFGGLPHE